jgi:XapX domain-containing protein
MSYLISLGVGFVVGIAYWLLKVQSPAPPLIALAGLLGMVLGEHAIPAAKAQFFTERVSTQTVGQDNPCDLVARKSNDHPPRTGL